MFHSDRGSVHASKSHRMLLKGYGFNGSMGRRGNPCDNAAAESLMKTLKAAAVHLADHEAFEDAAHLPRFTEQVCNETRLHSALGYLSPARSPPGFIIALPEDDGEATALASFTATQALLERVAVHGGVQRGLSDDFTEPSEFIVEQDDECGLEAFHVVGLTPRARLKGEIRITRPSTEALDTAVATGPRLQLCC